MRLVTSATSTEPALEGRLERKRWQQSVAKQIDVTRGGRLNWKFGARRSVVLLQGLGGESPGDRREEHVASGLRESAEGLSTPSIQRAAARIDLILARSATRIGPLDGTARPASSRITTTAVLRISFRPTCCGVASCRSLLKTGRATSAPTAATVPPSRAGWSAHPRDLSLWGRRCRCWIYYPLRQPAGLTLQASGAGGRSAAQDGRTTAPVGKPRRGSASTPGVASSRIDARKVVYIRLRWLKGCKCRTCKVTLSIRASERRLRAFRMAASARDPRASY